MKINREILWKRHEQVQAQLRQFEKWYDSTSTVLMDLEEKRQEIVKKYFVFVDGPLRSTSRGSIFRYWVRIFPTMTKKWVI